MDRLWERMQRSLRYGYLRLMRIKSPPHETALGLAIGVFIGCLPVIPFQTVLALALAFMLRSNKVAAAIGTWVSNPANVAFFYYFLYKVGNLFVPIEGVHLDLRHLALSEMLNTGWQLVFIMSVGGIIIGIPASIATYFVTMRLIRVYHDKRAARRYQKSLNKYKVLP